MGRTEEGRSELVELADDSASSTDATIPSSPRGARSMTGRQSVPLCLERGEAVDVGTGMRESKTPERTLYGHTRSGADPGDTEQRLKPNGEQAESRMTNKEFWPC